MRALIILLLITFATFANAKEDKQLDTTLYGSFLHTGMVPNALFFFNDIQQYDSFELRRALRNHNIDTVVLGSNGGSVWEGLNIAAIINDKDIITYVPTLPNNMGCYSACSFIFFGGKIRRADGILAVHQAGAYGSERDKQKAQVSETQQNTQFTVSEIIGFLNEFDTPPWVYEKMFRSREFHIFDEAEKTRLAARSEEITPTNIDDINTFIKLFFQKMDTSPTQKIDKTPTPEQSDVDVKLVIMEIQRLLNAVGCNAGIEDGIWGTKTEAAAVLFAKTADLPTSNDDLITQAFVEALKNAPQNFCPKRKVVNDRRSSLASSELTGDWTLRSTCGSQTGKNFSLKKTSSYGGSDIYTSYGYFKNNDLIHVKETDVLMFYIDNSGIKNGSLRFYRNKKAGTHLIYDAIRQDKCRFTIKKR